jgi:mono/diheme cytochrome c family protein
MGYRKLQAGQWLRAEMLRAIGQGALLIVLVIAAPALCAGASASAPVDFDRDVRPVLAANCFSCHGFDAKARQAGLRLDAREGALQRLPSGRTAIVAGKPDASELFRRVSAPAAQRMPPPYSGKTLTPAQVATLRRWIEQGAAYARHWAFVPPQRPELPAVKNAGWAMNPIDRFILARLEERGLRPSPPADRVTLIRRVSLDLTGLPPTIAEVQAFLADTKPGAYERVVDRLLQSPHYGEIWARHWLDVARYADSNGFSIDAPRSIWKYRDWVIDAFNRDMPFDRFAIEQLAGDMLPAATLEQRIATGFHRNTPFNQEGGIDLEQFRVESVVNRVNTTATAFLGLTLGCSQCHDHKFDPFTQKEYYRLYAFFNNADEPDLELATPEEIARRDALRTGTTALQQELNRYLKSFLPELPQWEQSLTAEARQSLPDEVRTLLEMVAEKRTESQQLTLLRAFKAEDAGYKERAARVADAGKRLPALPTTLVMRERPTPRESYIQIQGDFTRKGEVVTPGVPAVLHSLPTGPAAPNRLDFARWLTDPRNPLTARVKVNRIWQQYFGRGLVETENDFGTQGTRPSHPELLDWLAVEFMARSDARPSVLGARLDTEPTGLVGAEHRAPSTEHQASDPYACGWSMKAMHRLIVTSAAYRQSSGFRPELQRADPRNLLLGRQARLRLDAEVVRDVALASSGLLSPKIGGPSVFPPQPEGVAALTQVKRAWVVSAGEDRYRRGMYTFFFRSAAHPALTVFDAPESVGTCTRRNRSNTPLQALTLLNDEGFFELSQALAARVLKEAPASDAARVRYLFRLCLAREPGAVESRRLLALLAQERAGLATSPEDARAIAAAAAEGTDAADLAAWTLVARVVLNLDEFITRE